MRKIIVLIVLVLSSVVIYGQEDNKSAQFEKIKNEFKKYQNSNTSGKFFYEFISLENDVLVIDKFHYMNTKRTPYEKIHVPVKEMDFSTAKYRRGILFNTKGNKNVIKYFFGPNTKTKDVLNLHPRAGKKKDKEIMVMLAAFFKNY